MNSGSALSPLARHFALFAEKLNGAPDPALFAAAALVCECGGQGHVCLDLNNPSPNPADMGLGPVPDPESWRNCLFSSKVVGRPGEFKPLVLDNAGRLYLHRFYSRERGLADSILGRCRSLAPGIDRKRLSESLERLFPGASGRADWQKTAAAAAVLRRFSVISGGPGTGKTRTAARIIALILELEGAANGPVLLCAPTGKAAARLGSAVAAAREELSSGWPDALREAFPERASTIHRLLGIGPGRPGGGYGPDRPLAAGTVVVDEASMVDLVLMSRLFSALSEKTRVILLGDRNQLASVDPGSVLGDLCISDANGFSPEFAALMESVTGCPALADPHRAPGLADSVVYLKENYRFGGDSEVAELSSLIIEGNDRGTVRFLESRKSGKGAVSFLEYADPAELSAILKDRMFAGYTPFLETGNVQDALARLDGFRVLAAHREGPGSTAHANAVFESALAARGMIFPGQSRHYDHRGIIVTRNDSGSNLNNGDCGVMMDGRAWFPGPEDEPVSFPPLVLPPHDTVFSMTVHKSQGAEFGEVLIVLPPRPSPVITRELLYTAVTRAKTRVAVVSPPSVAAFAVKAAISRRSGLSDMLKEM